MQRHFDDELTKLKTDLLHMASLTEKAIFNAVESLVKHDIVLAKKVIQEDELIDELELAIDERVIDLLALRQPMAVDLRFITTGMKINMELERIADLAENICNCVLELPERLMQEPVEDIKQLGSIARSMVKKAIDSFIQKDESMAKEVILMDPQADNLRNKVNKNLVCDYIAKNGKIAVKAVPMILVARHLERICDHATYIAQDIIYMINAKVVRHHPEILEEKDSD
ncbi:MAG: phosphate signaling complex protein PhoU [Elusimicrobia bacterium]|nr:phosphate signaling complex protein PhoU [Elusimicrobiota bacterium]